MLLNCHTYYSFCYGTFDVEELLRALKAKGYHAFVLSDINNTSACLDAVRIAPGVGIRPVLGIDFRNRAQQQYIGVARNNEGFRELNAHLSKHLHGQLDFEKTAPAFNNAYVIYPMATYEGWSLKDNEYLGVTIQDFKNYKLRPYLVQEHKLVVLHTVSFQDATMYNAHRLLRAIDNNTLLSMLSPAQQAGKGTGLIPSRQELYAAFAAYPGIIANTERLIEHSSIDFEFGKLANKNLKQFEHNRDNMQLLRDKCREGLNYRYPHLSSEIEQRIEKELRIIEKKDFASYYLINGDIVNYARNKGYYYVGRGSGANSIVAYLLRITDVDPIELDLYFERFINEDRQNAPDFDIDFSWRDRDDITRYIFERFNRNNNTALLGAYHTFQSNSVIRELGKVFGLAPREIDGLQNAGTYSDNLGKLVLKYSKLIHDFPSHLSIHASGIIISEKPIYSYSATSLPPKGYPTTQFSMLEAEDIGLFKFDILSQRGLGKIKDSLDIIKQNKGAHIDIHDVNRFKKDEAVKNLLRVGNTIGCFYVESPAMRMLLAKLRADDYLRLVAASSIIRPGVAKSGMMREYIERYRNEHLREKARMRQPELYKLLEETYGVMVYQEDVIKIAHKFAGLTLAEADCLRRGMSWKFKQRNEFHAVREKFFSNCAAKGYAADMVKETWQQIETFANFAFSKGHSASYAVESYQALFLKAYYPLEYMVATLNNGGGFYRKDLYVHEARMHGAGIHAPCVNNSTDLCVIKGKEIFLGLNMIGELEEKTRETIINARGEIPFASLADFVKRVPVTIDQLRLLIRSGAFQFTGKRKAELLWEAYALLPSNAPKVKKIDLFEPVVKEWTLPELSHSALDDAFDEIELLGFSLCPPFALLREPVKTTLTARELKQYINTEVMITGYMISVKHTQTARGEKMYFGTFIDTEGHWIDTVHFPQSARKYSFTGPGCYIMKGRVTEEYDFLSIEVSAMKHLPVVDREK